MLSLFISEMLCYHVQVHVVGVVFVAKVTLYLIFVWMMNELNYQLHIFY